MLRTKRLTPNKNVETEQPSDVVRVDMKGADDSSPPLKKQDSVSRATDWFWKPNCRLFKRRAPSIEIIDLESEQSSDTVIGIDSSPKLRKQDAFSRGIEWFLKANSRFFKRHGSIIRIVLLIALNIGIGVYLYFATRYWMQTGESQWKWCDGYGFLIILLTTIYLLLLYYHVLKPYLGEAFYERCFVHVDTFWDSLWERSVVFRGIVYLVPLGALSTYLAIDTGGNRDRLISFCGLIILLILGFIFSKYPGQIHWRPVFWGLALQFIFGLLTIRWRTGREVCRCFADRVALFIAYSYNGSSFVYGQFLVYETHNFAFQFLSVIFFFSFVISVMFYLGALQSIIMKLGWIMQKSCGTTVVESVTFVTSIFLGQTEAPLVIRPYMKGMTRSEMHAVMTSGFATISGSILSPLISFGVSPAHLLAASVMSAPATLCFTKLFYPETEVSKTTVENIVMDEGTDTSILDAATRGALSAVAIVMGIISNLVSYLAITAFFDAVWLWTFELVGLQEWSFLIVVGYIFLPFAYIMGVEPDDCQEVAKLIGLKTMVNEFLAYQELGKLTKVCAISLRSEAIATFAMCGFANPGSVGIQVGALSTMCPDQRSNITSVAFRAFIAGSVCSFMTACIAGILLPEDSFDDYISHRNCTHET